MVNGDCDDQRTYPDDAVLAIGDLKVGLIHGHQVRGSPCRSRAPPLGYWEGLAQTWADQNDDVMC